MHIVQQCTIRWTEHQCLNMTSLLAGSNTDGKMPSDAATLSAKICEPGEHILNSGAAREGTATGTVPSPGHPTLSSPTHTSKPQQAASAQPALPAESNASPGSVPSQQPEGHTDTRAEPNALPKSPLGREAQQPSTGSPERPALKGKASAPFKGATMRMHEKALSGLQPVALGEHPLICLRGVRAPVSMKCALGVFKWCVTGWRRVSWQQLTGLLAHQHETGLGSDGR